MVTKTLSKPQKGKTKVRKSKRKDTRSSVQRLEDMAARKKARGKK